MALAACRKSGELLFVKMIQRSKVRQFSTFISFHVVKMLFSLFPVANLLCWWYPKSSKIGCSSTFCYRNELPIGNCPRD